MNERAMILAILAVSALVALGGIKLFAIQVWNDPEMIFRHVFLFPWIEQSLWAALPLLAIFWAWKNLDSFESPLNRKHRVYLGCIKIGAYSYLTMCFLLALQALFVTNNVWFNLTGFLSMFLGNVLIGGIVFGWLVVLASLLGAFSILVLTTRPKSG